MRVALNFWREGQTQEENKLLLVYVQVSATKQNVCIDISLKM
jgi:hypothetical protein